MDKLKTVGTVIFAIILMITVMLPSFITGFIFACMQSSFLAGTKEADNFLKND